MLVEGVIRRKDDCDDLRIQKADGGGQTMAFSAKSLVNSEGRSIGEMMAWWQVILFVLGTVSLWALSAWLSWMTAPER